MPTLLIGGDKSGVNEKRFYKQLIAKADKLYAAHLLVVEQRRRKQEKKVAGESGGEVKRTKRKGK